MKKILKIHYFTYLAIVLFLIMIVGMVFSYKFDIKAVISTKPVQYEGWQIQFEDGSLKEIQLPSSVNVKKQEHVVLKNKVLPDMAGMTVAFRTTDQNVIARLDGEIIYQYVNMDERLYVKSPGSLWHFVTIPENINSGNLELELYSPYKDLGTRITEIVYGNRSECIVNFVYDQWMHLIVGVSMLVIGLLFGLFYYALGHLKLQNTGLFYFGSAAALLAINMIVMSGVLQIFFGNAIVYYLLRYGTMFFLMVPFLIFLSKTVLKAYRRALTKISWIYLMLFFFLVTLQWTGIADFAYFGHVIWIINIAIFLMIIIMSCSRLKKGKKKELHLPLAVLCFVESAGIVADYFLHYGESVGLRHYGMVLLFLVIGSGNLISVVRRYRTELDEKMQLNNVAMQTLAESQAAMSKKMESFELAKEEAEELNNIKSIYLENVAKKLLMPMSHIAGLNELILRDEINDNVREKALDIQTEANIMVTLINNLIDYSKVENGQMEIKTVAYHVENLLYDMSQLVSVGIIDKKIDFIVDFSPNIPRELLGDEIRIRQILTNILSNAVRFTEEGTIRFKVEAVLTDADEVMLTFTISDTGIGIHEEKLDNIFENAMMSDLYSTMDKGTGLGLSVCKKLIDLMGGSIEADSKVGEGSVFSISLPQKIINGMPLVEMENREYKVLIFETNQLQRMMMKKTCKDLELEADFVYDMEEFKKNLETNVYHTVLICEEEYPSCSEYLDSDVYAGVRRVVLLNVENSMNSYEDADVLQRPVQCMNLYDAISGKDMAEPIVIEHVQQFTAPFANVLIVDDNPANLKIALGLLEPYKMQLTTALNGNECLELLKDEQKYDLVFLDYSMPETSGVEILHEIRELEDKYYKTLPIVAMTSQKINGAKELFVSEGFDHYIDKPFEAVHLEKILEQFLSDDKVIHSESDSEEESQPEEVYEEFESYEE